MTRARKEQWLKANDNRHAGLGFDDALCRLIRANGLGWFTDEQIDDLTSEMVSRFRADQQFRVQQRQQARRHAA